MKSWYAIALSELVSQFGSEPRVNGRDFLEDFVLKYREEYFQDLEFDEVDPFVSSEFDDFEDWLKKQERVKVLPNGKWFPRPKDDNSIQPEVPDAFELVEEVSLTEEESKLLKLEIYELSSEHYSDFKALDSKLTATNLSNSKYKCAVRLATCGEKSRDLLDDQVIQLWLNASVAASEAGFSKNACESLSEAGYHYLRISKHKEAAESFERAAKMLGTKDFKDKSQLLKLSRTQYQMVGDHEAAANVFSEEKNIEYAEASFRLRLVLLLYRITSDYGESPGRVALNVFFILVFATVLSYLSGIRYGSPFFERVIDCFYYSVVTFTTLGYGDIYPVTIPGKLLAGALAILGLLYTSLFMVTVVRKYARA